VNKNKSDSNNMLQITGWLLAIAIIVLSACTSTAPKIAPVDFYPEPVAGSELTCSDDQLNHCALSSPLIDVIDTLYNGGGYHTGKHLVTNLAIGDQALILRIHMIRAARKNIEVQTYIWAKDETGALIYSELLAAAKRGVKVRVIADQLYSISDPENAAKVAVAHENLQIKLFNPLGQKAVASTMDKIRGALFDFSTLNHRMHNKLMVFDKQIGITGGRNIENRYYDMDPEFNFLDRDVLVIGPAVKDMANSFDEYWNDPITVELHQLEDVHTHLFTDGVQNKQPPVSVPDLSLFDELIESAEDLEFIKARFLDMAHTVDDVSFTADRPQKAFIKDKESDLRVIGELANVVKGAKESVVMQTPYFILSKPAYNVFHELREIKPDLKFIVSTNSLASTDQYLVYALSFKRKKRNVEKLGFQIYELKPVPGDITMLVPRYSYLTQHDTSAEKLEYESVGSNGRQQFSPVPIEQEGPRFCIHAKSLVIDSRIAVIGSHNFDPRSLYLNTELTLTVRDEAFAKEIELGILQITQPQNSWVIAKRRKVPLLGQISGLFASISRVLPVFDLWPFRYTALFELQDGKKPVSPDHPDFFSNYHNVGQFPGTKLGDNQIKTLLVSGFGAIAEPLM